MASLVRPIACEIVLGHRRQRRRPERTFDSRQIETELKAACAGCLNAASYDLNGAGLTRRRGHAQYELGWIDTAIGGNLCT